MSETDAFEADDDYPTEVDILEIQDYVSRKERIYRAAIDRLEATKREVSEAERALEDAEWNFEFAVQELKEMMESVRNQSEGEE